MYPTGWVRVFDQGDSELPAWNVGTGHGRGAIAVTEDAVWVANSWSRTVARLDRPDFDLTSLLKVRKVPVAISAGNAAVWVLCANGWLWRVWPDGPHVEGVARLGPHARALAATDSWIWVLRRGGELARIEPATGEVTLRTSIGRDARQIVAGEDALWLIYRRGRRLARVDPNSGKVEAEVKPPHQVVCLAAEGETIWFGCRRRLSAQKGWLYALDPGTLEVGVPRELPAQPRALIADGDAVWLACARRGRRAGTIERFDRRTGTLQEWAATDWPAYDLALAKDSVLATMGISVSSTFDGGAGYFDLGGGGGGDGGGGGHGHG